METSFNYFVKDKKGQILLKNKGIDLKNSVLIKTEIIKKYQYGISLPINAVESSLNLLSIEDKLKKLFSFHKRTKYFNLNKNEINLFSLFLNEDNNFDVSFYRGLSYNQKRKMSQLIHKFDKI